MDGVKLGEQATKISRDGDWWELLGGSEAVTRAKSPLLMELMPHAVERFRASRIKL